MSEQDSTLTCMKITRTSDGRALARFRADPTRVRVSIRRVDSGFTVTIAERWGSGRSVTGTHRVARSALYRALQAADSAGLRGVDPCMESTYDHPQISPTRFNPWTGTNGIVSNEFGGGGGGGVNGGEYGGTIGGNGMGQNAGVSLAAARERLDS